MEPEPMDGSPGLTAMTSIRRFARRRTAAERCEMCDAELAANHSHLVEPASRRLACTCEACAILFSGRSDTKFRRVPRLVRFLADFRMTDQAWDGLQLPINLAFFLRSTPAGRVVALYPSPAGATESLVEPDSWRTLEDENPILRSLEPDVEALLVNRVKESRECYLVGIDECYKIAGLIRTHWRGLSGGQAAWDEIERFFADLKGRQTHA